MTTQPEFQNPISTVDAVVLTIDEGELKVLLHRRPREPFQGAWALPGGFIHADKDEDTEAAIRRILKTKTGAAGFYLEQLAVFSGLKRDPRGWSLSVAHVALVPRENLKINGGDDVSLVSVDALPKLAFDHNHIIDAAVFRLRGKGAYSTLPASFLGETFTFFEIQRAYEIVLGTKLDQSAFRRKVMVLGILEETDEVSQDLSRRPAKLFRLKDKVSTFDRTIG